MPLSYRRLSPGQFHRLTIEQFNQLLADSPLESVWTVKGSVLQPRGGAMTHQPKSLLHQHQPRSIVISFKPNRATTYQPIAVVTIEDSQ